MSIASAVPADRRDAEGPSARKGLGCPSPTVAEVWHPMSVYLRSEARMSAVTFTRSGRPDLAIVEGQLTLIACRSPDCSRRGQATAPVSSLPRLAFSDVFTPQISVASTPSGVPAAALPSRWGANLVACRNRACTGGATVHPLPIPGGFRSWPTLAIGRSGRPQVAGLYGGWLVLASCPDLGCAHPVVRRLVATSQPTPIGVAHMVVGGDGRPFVAWQNFFVGIYGKLHVLACHRGCGRA